MSFLTFQVSLLDHHFHPFSPRNLEAVARYPVIRNSDAVAGCRFEEHPSPVWFAIKYLFSATKKYQQFRKVILGIDES